MLNLNNESSKIQKESELHEEFKRLLSKQIQKKDKIWSDGDKFDIDKFLEEPYLGKVNKIISNHAKTFLVFFIKLLSVNLRYFLSLPSKVKL